MTSRRFGPFFVGRGLAASGTWMHNLAAGILIYRLTGSELLLGVLAMMQFLPTLVLAPLAGAVADRHDRRRIVVLMGLLSACAAAALAALAWADMAPVAIVLGLSLALGVSQAFTVPASAALLSELVDAEDLASAVALNSMTFNLARSVGPLLAAVVIGTLGVPAAFAINAGAYLAFAAAVASISTVARAAAAREASIRLRDTIALVRREPLLWSSLVVVMVAGFAADPINTLAPAFAIDFGRPDTEAGFVVGAFGAGAVIAAITLTGRLGISSRSLGAALVGMGAGIAVFSITPSFLPALLILSVAGFCYLSSNAAATTRLQLGVEEGHRGRIMALWSLAFLGMRPLASLLDGTIASLFGVRTAGIVLALPAVAVGLALATGRPRLRDR